MMTPEQAYARVEQLVWKFKALSAAQRKGMNENATRQGFILPLFAALGWNIEDVNEVSPEERVSRGWVDFAFRLSGVPRFFLETKKISEDLDDPRWVKQAIDYAWHKSVAWALLSDFEGLRLFNAEWQETDPLRAQFIEFSVDTYLSDFERLGWLSRPQIAAGTLDREAERVGKKIRRVPVTQSLFDDLKNWRHELFRHLRAYNLLSDADIDQAVLRILNRLIFIRTAEDREVEPQRLLPLVRELTTARRLNDLPRHLAGLFREFDSLYNSELFAPHFSEGLDCEPAPFETLIKGLYERGYTRYNFNALEADVLGTVYEQYLGHVIAVPSAALTTRGKRAAQLPLDAGSLTVVEKRQKRKSQGIYYTPAFVVKYIVQHTLSRYLEGHSYHPARPVRVLDMACGSGSFLIEAFDVLDRHIAQMRGQTAPLVPGPSGRGGEGGVHDHARGVEILTQCLHGVDKDRQAVDVARLNLMLRGLHTRDRLPKLENIRVGDSLISGTPDELLAAFGEDWKAKLPFNWEKEFPQVFGGDPHPQPLSLQGRGEATRSVARGEGGFDVIIGNPPYVRPHNLPAESKAFFWKHYPTFVGKSDLYCCFIQRAIELAKPGGYIGFVVSDGWLRLDSFQAIRSYILSTCKVLELIDLPDKVFAQASVKTGIFILQKEALSPNRSSTHIQILELSEDETRPTHLRDIQQSIFENTHRNVFDTSLSLEFKSFKLKIETDNPKISEIADIRFGLKTGDDSKFIHNKPKTKNHKRLLRGENVHRYRIDFAEEYVWYVPEKMREHKKTARPGEPERFEQDKILVRDTGYRFECTLDVEHHYVKDVLILTQGTGNIYSLRYIVGLLNSKLMRYYYETSFPTLHVQNSEIAILPIRRINFDDPAEKAQHDAIVALVTEMLDLQKEHAEAERAQDDRRHALARRIAEVDAALDRAVYQLYGLTEAEIGVVEGK